jgi:DNA-binding NarL/FixJ family response regulator
MELNAILAENHSLHGTLELKRKEIINVALGISEQKEFLEMLAEKVHSAAKASSEEKDRIIAEIEKELGQRTSFSGEIDEFYTQAEVLHKDFSVKLTEEFPNLTVSERRLATLLRLGFSSKYIATLMNISPKSVEISRYRLRQKLGLKKGDNLINFIKSI